MRKGLQGFPKKIKCTDCTIEFVASNPIHKRCGNRDEKTGCSYLHRLSLNRLRCSEERKTLKYKEWYRKYDKEWKRKKRLDPEYKKKCYETTKKWVNSLEGIQWKKDNYKRYLPSKLEINRHRRMKLKGVKGKHTNREWEYKKKCFNYSCATCGISEEVIKIKWAGTQFTKLTKDHIIPISKGGTDNIENIQPLCVSCNSKKIDKLNIKGIVGITFGAMSLCHAGHILMFDECKKNCDYLIVGLHEDPSIERPEKTKPIETIDERLVRLSSIRYIDNIIVYKTEEDLLNILKNVNPDIRFIGEDHKGKPFTGDNLPIKIFWNRRKHDYSSSNLIERIKNA
jgi:glycerol-3-phosphate cytidylyltransferase